jgi:hypothetical protein
MGLQGEITDAVMKRGEDQTLLGLSAFEAEQVLSVSIDLKKKIVEMDVLWEKKRKAIEATKGLSIWRGGEKFADLVGLENAKTFLRSILNGKDAPLVVLRIDEIEK